MKANSRENTRSAYALAIVFLCGMLMIILPPIIELAGYGSDNAEYTAISNVFKPPDEPPEIDPFIVKSQPKETEEPTVQPPRKDPSETESPEEVIMSEEPESTVSEDEPLVSETGSPPLAALEPIIDEDDQPDATEKPKADITPDPSPKKPPRATKEPDIDSRTAFEKLQDQNKDFIAWITIPGTPVDYPVVQSNNSDYYLSHLFTGSKSKLGCLFSLKNANYRLPGRNIAIYGHHLSASDAMFSSLLNYKKPSYYDAHPTIHLHSLYHDSTYRIFAVLNMNISDWDPATASFSSDSAFLKFVNRAQKNAMYDTGISVKAEDRILTLITCDRDYGGVSGRFIVMAVLEN